MSSSPAVLRAFAGLLAAKILVSSVAVAVARPDLAPLVMAASSAVALAGLLRNAALGPAALLVACALAVATSFPHTLNHEWFELFAAFVLLHVAIAPAAERIRAAVRARLLLQLAILSVFVFSGLQKLVHGRFLSGEHLLAVVLLEQDDMARILAAAASLLGFVPKVDTSALLFGPVALALPAHLHAAARVVSLGIVATEIVLPLLVALRVPTTRWCLLAAQVGIGLVSGEYGFAITATGALLLLWHRPPRAAWIAALVCWVVLAAICWS